MLQLLSKKHENAMVARYEEKIEEITAKRLSIAKEDSEEVKIEMEVSISLLTIEATYLRDGLHKIGNFTY